MLKIAFDPIYEHPLPEGHRFPMHKYSLLREQLLYEGTITESNLFSPTLPNSGLVTIAHDPGYVHKLQTLSLSQSEIRKTGFPLSAQLVEREMVIMNGTWLCAKHALAYGVAMNIAGGTHHAFSDRGEGFCLLNDMAVAATNLLKEGLAKKILIVDLDVHQGNGTAQIFQHEPRVFTFSMHGANNYPAQKEKSDLDIGLPNGTDDYTYLNILQKTLPELFDQVMPDFVFYQSGVDVLATDKLGKLALTIQGCRQRDKIVLSTCKAHQIPIVISMGGGYSERASHIVDAHANTFRLAQELYF
jgi:acetoin utilization deacetylase AcuC-like enzyme